MRWIFRFLLILHLQQISIGDCQTKFFAKRIAYEDASSLSFYFTSTNISSTVECAIFCAKRQFCRTAMFNALAGTCSISYDWKVNCRHQIERYDSFVISKKHLVLIACIEKCKSTHSLESIRQNSSTKDIFASNRRTNNLLTTIQTKDDNIQRYDETNSKPLTIKDSNRISSMERILEDENENESTLAFPSRYPHYLYRVILDRHNGIRKKVLNGDHEGVDHSESYRKFPEIPSKKTTPPGYIEVAPSPTKKNISEMQNVTIPSQKWEASPKIVENKQLSNSTNKILDKSDEESAHENGERAFPLLEWKKISMQKKNAENDEGFLNKIIIEGIHANKAETIHDSSGENVLNEEGNSLRGINNNNERRIESLKFFPTSHSEIAKCFDIIKRQFLLNAGYEMYANLSREECRCLCAETWSAKRSTRKCKSFQYNALRECLLNKDDHFGKYDLVYDLTAEYHFINCSEPLFSTRSMNECRKQFHLTINEETATKVFSHSFAATLPIFSTSALSGRNRIGVSDFRKTNKATTTTSSSSSTTLEPSLSSRESEATDIRWLMKTSYERVIAFESTPKRIFHSVTTATTQPMTSAELNIFTTPMDASFTNSEAQWEVLTTNKDDSNTTSSTSKSSKGSSDSREFLTASARSVTTATLSTIYTRPNEAVTGTLKKTSLEGIEANRSTEIVEVEFTPSRKTLLSQQTFPQMRNSVGPIQSQKADVKGLRNESTKPTSERTTTELASESRAIDSAESTPESGEIDSVETTLANRVTEPTETTSESRATEPTESIPESEETNSAESTPEGGATDSTESTPERSTSATAESASENRTTWLKQSVAEGELLEATTETSAESSTTSVNAMAIELQQIGNRFTPKTPENEEDDEKNERGTSTPSITSNKNNNVIIDESEISESMTSSTSTQSCFEVLDGFLMKSTAGGLENDVSLEECKCFCATSRISSRYSFQCASATYYHNERDCVLNLDSRIQRINLLRENFQTAFNVTYIGLLCSPDESIKHLSNEERENGCRTFMPSSVITTTQSSTTKISSGRYTDNCFLELPNFVLEGMALAIEDNITIETCKCYCINARYRYGSECQSLQYYFDSNTCLINKENRLSNLDRFNFAPTATMKHSYFDFRCLTDQGVLSTYVAEVCSTIVDIKPKWIKLPKNDIPYESEEQKNNRREGNEIFDDDIHMKPTKLPSNMINIRIEVTNTTAGTQNKQSATFDNDEEENVSTPSSHIPTVGTYSPRNSEVSEEAISEAEETDDDAHNDDMKMLKTTTTLVSSSASASTDGDITTVLPSTRLTSEDISTTMQTETIATTQQTTTTTTYIPAGPCTYSAIYQTSFKGAKLIKRILVSSPAQCFSGCYHEGCRSANLIQFSGVLKYCELYRDALIDYRTPDVLGFDSSAVYFDGIKCEGISS